MAKLLDHTDLTYLSFPIIKSERTPDGDLLVWGKATDGSVDSDQQIVDPEWSAKALEKWLTTGGNVRVMHSTSHLPAGKGVEVDTSKGDGHYVRAMVVEPTAQKLVEKGVLQAYSVGISNPKIVRDPLARGGRIVGGDIHELSLVDRPANKNCGITLVKSAGDGSAEDAEELFGEYEELFKGENPFTKDDEDATDEKPVADAEDSEDAEEVDEDDEDTPEAEDVAKGAWDLERAQWLAREPLPDAEAPRSGTAFLAKRAAWEKWHAEGEAALLEEADYPRWLTKRETVLSEDLDGLLGLDALESAVADLEPVTKADKACPNPDCDADHHADSKLRRCEKCGTKLPKAKKTKNKGAKVGKGKRSMPADVHGAGVHREPDGDLIELFERETGMHTTPDAMHDKVPASLKVSDYQLKRMHDATCAAFDWRTVSEEYPSLSSVADAIVPGYFQAQVQAAALKGDMLEAATCAEVALVAEEITKGAYDPDAVADGHAALHKMFQEMYPNVRVTPGDVTPGMFQRPYISAGHAPLSASGAARASNVPPSSRVPDPNDFDRPLITAGHEADSPSNRGNNLRTRDVSSGASRQFYGNAARDAAKSAMQALHDHIAGVTPDMCSMAPSRAVMPPNMGDTNTLRPVEPLAVPAAPGERSMGKVAKPLGKKQLAGIIKEAVAEATKGIRTGYEAHIAALEAQIDELGAMPDPAQAPLRGVVRKAASTTDEADTVPVERMSLIEKAQAQAVQAREEEIEFLKKFLNHPSPEKRELAEAQLRKILATP